MKYFVTGGSGYIGSNLIRALLEDDENAEILSMDNYQMGSRENESKDERVKYVEDDTRKINDNPEYLDFNPDYFFHFGEYARIGQSTKEPEKAIRYNIFGTFEVLEYCRKKNCKLIYSGSSSIFTKEEEHKNPYTWSKAKNTELINNYKEWVKYDNWAIAYFSNVYGGNERGDGDYATVVAKFIRRFNEKKPLKITGDGSQERAFTHIDDTIRGLILVAREGKGDEYVIRADKQYSIKEVTGWFEEKGAEIAKVDKHVGRMKSKGSAEKLKKLGWEAKIDLKDHITEILKDPLTP